MLLVRLCMRVVSSFIRNVCRPFLGPSIRLLLFREPKFGNHEVRISDFRGLAAEQVSPSPSPAFSDREPASGCFQFEKWVRLWVRATSFSDGVPY